MPAGGRGQAAHPAGRVSPGGTVDVPARRPTHTGGGTPAHARPRPGERGGRPRALLAVLPSRLLARHAAARHARVLGGAHAGRLPHGVAEGVALRPGAGAPLDLAHGDRPQPGGRPAATRPRRGAAPPGARGRAPRAAGSHGRGRDRAEPRDGPSGHGQPLALRAQAAVPGLFPRLDGPGDRAGGRRAPRHREDEAPHGPHPAPPLAGEGRLMDCLDVRDRLADYVLGGCAPEEAAAVRRHLEWCAGCRKELAELEEGVATVGWSLDPVRPPEDLEERVVDAVAEAAGARRTERRRFRLVTAVAVLATFLAVGAVGWSMAMAGRLGQAQAEAREATGEASRLSEFLRSVGGQR